MTAEIWPSMVAVLADMPDVIERLRAEHTADARGRCVACTVPGLGTPGAPWPCTLATLAADAERVRRGTR